MEDAGSLEKTHLLLSEKSPVPHGKEKKKRKKKMAKLLELRGGMAVDSFAPMFPPNPQRAPLEGREASEKRKVSLKT